jgi:phage shock protein C
MTMANSQLYRSPDNRMIAGVAAGLAEYFKIDVSLIRLLWIIAVFWGGSGLLAYLIAWIVIPERKNNHANPASETQHTENSPEIQEKTAADNSAAVGAVPENKDLPWVGLLLIGLGFFLLFKSIFPGHWLQYSWSLFLIVCGIWLLVKDKRA